MTNHTTTRSRVHNQESVIRASAGRKKFKAVITSIIAVNRLQILGNDLMKQCMQDVHVTKHFNKDLNPNLDMRTNNYFNAKRKFKAAVSTVVAINRMQVLGHDQVVAINRMQVNTFDHPFRHTVEHYERVP